MRDCHSTPEWSDGLLPSVEELLDLLDEDVPNRGVVSQREEPLVIRDGVVLRVITPDDGNDDHIGISDEGCGCSREQDPRLVSGRCQVPQAGLFARQGRLRLIR